MVNAASVTMLVRVLSVRAQDRRGSIFRAQRIREDGAILDTHSEVVARLQAGAIGVRIFPGQWWFLSGMQTTKSFVNAAGFQMTENHLEVEAGGAELRLPDGAHIVDFLARNGRFEGIGRITAQRLWETFKRGLVDILDDGDYTALADVISPGKAKMLIEGWKEEGLSQTLQWLQSNGIGMPIGRRIVEHFGADAVAKIEENPYRLLSFSAGWDEVDQLARQALAVKPEDDRRLAAALEEVVYRRFSRGDTFVPKAALVDGFTRLLGNGAGARKLASHALELAERSRRLLFDRSGNAYSLGASILENRVVDAIAVRSNQASPPCDVSAVIAAYEAREGHGFKLNDEQAAAVHMVAQHHFSVITGGAGCGKTTVLKAVCDVLDDQHYEVVQLALAGKAVRRMMDSTGRPASTLASFLSNASKSEAHRTGVGYRAILIDEASMVDLLSFASLVSHLKPEEKIVLIGDPHQLPPVGPGLVLHCLAGSDVPHVELKIANRFGSEIAQAANAIRDGELPSLGCTGAVRLIETSDPAMAEAATDLYMQAPDETVVLTATRAMAASINQCVQQRISIDRREVRVWNDEFDCYEASGLREGDLVICTENHWDLGLQNGSIGRIISTSSNVDEALGAIEWDDGQLREFNSDLLDSLELAFALTTHKSQGSQWKRVLVCLPSSSRMIDRSLIYTAVTRAQTQVLILGHREFIHRTVKQAKAADRRLVGLTKRLALRSVTSA